MRLLELFEAADLSPDFFHELKKASGSPTKMDGGRPYYPEFDRVDIHVDKIRFAATGKAGEFMASPQGEQFCLQHGWIITVLRPHEEQRGFNQDGTPRMFKFVEVRLEHPEKAQQPQEWNKVTELFHVTPTQNVQSILQQGLEPRGPTRPDMHRYPPRIHFARSMEAAIRMKGMFEKYDAKNGIHRDYSILQVDPAAVDPKYLDPEFHRDGIYTTKHVPASAIHLLG